MTPITFKRHHPASVERTVFAERIIYWEPASDGRTRIVLDTIDLLVGDAPREVEAKILAATQPKPKPETPAEQPKAGWYFRTDQITRTLLAVEPDGTRYIMPTSEVTGTVANTLMSRMIAALTKEAPTA